ncbi:sensor histidine kinase [Marinomonas algicola]|uniref:sensor histidine kinase n=1 Tax=Marinomonas algicola TaxID=2773454 RepID=UPI0017485DCB|nr:ATP-binding protein [Marinomonas algicola]
MFGFKSKLGYFLRVVVLRKLHAGYLITISSLFFVLSIGLLFLIYEEQRVITNPANENEVWASYTLELESYKLSNELSLFESNESTLESVHVRFEILFSRANILNSGKLKKIILKIPDSLTKLNDVIRLLNGIDAVLFSKNHLSREDISYINGEIKKIRQATEIMMSGILENRAVQKVERRDSLTSLFSLLILLLLFLIVTIPLIIISLFKQKKAINKSYLIERELSVNLNEALKKSEKATQAKSDFLATMSHEIRTPMNGIMGLGYLLGNTKLDEKQNEYLDKIQESANNLLLIINDILDLSKVEAGKLELEERIFSLDDILDSIYDLNSIKAKEKGILFFIERDFNLPDNYLGDPLRINQLLLNLVSNAVKFTHTGEVRVGISSDSPRNNEYDVKTDDNTLLKIVVSDTGIGMDKGYTEIIFDSFSQADTTTTRKYGGTGLGLAICKRFVDLMQGNIYVDSEFGKGTVFTVELPLKKANIKPCQETSTDSEVNDDIIKKSKKIGLVGFKDGVNELLCLYGYDAVKLTDSNDLNSSDFLDVVIILNYDVFLKEYFLNSDNKCDTANQV